ncbi:MAG: O-succinylhomoserine sulfhydrylase [Burkholderiales bacterium]|jgi:O-succinylhomoserine sulfhydrylase|nr:O-succinylhomoserine sulfhydrylase [Burkholderiales bacterium]
MTTKRPLPDPRNVDLDTLAIRGGTLRSEFNEHSEALFLTSSFVFNSAEEAAGLFSGAEDGFVYSRFSNPTVRMFEDRLAALEGAEAALATSSGMAAIFATAMATLKAGDHVVCGAGVFGATVQLFSSILARFGVATSYVRGSDMDAWRAAVTPATRLLFCETPSNPLGEVIDLAALAQLGRDHGALTVADNCFCTPILQRPLDFGVDLVVHTATKYLDGQGRVLGGAVVGRKALIRDAILPVLRSAGPSLSPFNAWVLLKGLETLGLRIRAQSAAALRLAEWLQAQPQIERVFFPGLTSHPQRALIERQQRGPGAVLSFELRGDGPEAQRARAWRVIDAVKLMSITANLGDTRTTITHPATTTHGRLTPEARARAGIGEGLVRLAVGLESVEDLMHDLAQALSA